MRPDVKGSEYDFECGHSYDYECRSYMTANVGICMTTNVAGDDEFAAEAF